VGQEEAAPEEEGLGCPGKAPGSINRPTTGTSVELGADKTRLSDDLLPIQSVLAISRADERLDFDQRECGSLGSAG